MHHWLADDNEIQGLRDTRKFELPCGVHLQNRKLTEYCAILINVRMRIYISS